MDNTTVNACIDMTAVKPNGKKVTAKEVWEVNRFIERARREGVAIPQSVVAKDFRIATLKAYVKAEVLRQIEEGGRKYTAHEVERARKDWKEASFNASFKQAVYTAKNKNKEKVAKPKRKDKSHALRFKTFTANVKRLEDIVLHSITLTHKKRIVAKMREKAQKKAS